MPRDRTPTPVDWINPPTPNGNRKLVWWMMTSFAAIAVAIGGLVYSSVDSELTALRRTDANRGERVSALEARSEESHRRLTAIDARLIVMDEKLNDVLREIQYTNRERRRR